MYDENQAQEPAYWRLWRYVLVTDEGKAHAHAHKFKKNGNSDLKIFE